MTLQEKIYRNMVEQIVNNLRVQSLREKIAEYDRQGQLTQGRMSILSEMIEEQDGIILQKAINTDPFWKEQIQLAQQEAQSIVSSESGNSIASQVEPQPETKKRDPIKQVSANRKVEGSQNNVAVVTDEQQEKLPQLQRTSLKDRRQPIKVVIDDAPAPPPPDGDVEDIDND